METHEGSVANGHASEGDGTGWVTDSAHKAWDRTRGAVSEIKRAAAIEERVNRHPYGSIAAAIGVGYVLGGGIFTSLTSRIVTLGLRIGIRLAVLPMLKDEISGLADALTGEGEGETKGRRPGKGAKSSEK
ncbi:MAG TPA: hypothetical protein VN853_00855 [Polyangia bacterium]|jgi:hypothetical protein|nr:hypothetical protein [Polyangia bacterium]